MPSALVYKANEINQLVSNLQLTMFPLRWSAEKLKWLYGSKYNWKRYLLIAVSWKVFLHTPLIAFAMQQLIVRKFDGPSVLRLTSSVFVLLLLWGSLYLDVLFWLYGKEVAACCNWCYKMEDMMSTQKLDSTTISKNHGKISQIEQTLKLFKTGLLLYLF